MTECGSVCPEETMASAPGAFDGGATRVAGQRIARLQAGLSESIPARGENLGHLEEQVLQQSREWSRRILEEAAQTKADAPPPRCMVCGGPSTRCTSGHARTFESRFGSLTLRRTRGWCRRCMQGCFPADAVLGLEATAGYSARGAGDGRVGGEQTARGRGQRGGGATDRR